MPFNKRFVSRRKPRRKTSKLVRDVRMLKSAFRSIERKYLDVVNNANVSTTPTLWLLNGIGQGDSPSQRTGQQIKVVYIWLQGYTSISTSATRTFVRFVIVRDEQANGAALTYASVYTGNTVLAPRDIDTSRRYKVLYDKRMALSINGTEARFFRAFIKRKFVVQYNGGNAGTIADINTNSIYAMAISSEATNAPDITFECRVRYTDA